MTTMRFPEIARVDALAKVRGERLFAADDSRRGMLHGAFAVATVGKGRLTSLDVAAAEAAPGVRLVLTHRDTAGMKEPGFVMGGGYGFQSHLPMLSDRIAYRGEPVALVVAESLEAAQAAAALVVAAYEAEAFDVTLDSPGVEVVDQAQTPLSQFIPPVAVGDADAAFAAAAVRIEARFESAPQHQNPIELVSAVTEWVDGRLIIHEGTQNAEAVRHGVAQVLGLDPAAVDVISPFVGGGFGQKNSMQAHTVFASEASRRLGAPVKVVVPRGQVYHLASFRPANRHHVRIGADRTGRMVAGIHEAQAQTSRHDLFPGEYATTSSRLYGIPNFRGKDELVRMDAQTPGYMRAPFEHTACFAFESCVDELAYALGMDPVALRLANDTDTDAVTGLPLSSRHVAECLRRGAEQFGWAARSMAPRSMSAPDGSQIGWGVAIGTYAGLRAPAIGRLRVTADGGVVFSIGVHEMGQGVRTALANVIARGLGVAPEAVTAEIGDTRAAPQHLTAGSWGTATVIPVAEEAVRLMSDELAKLGPGNDPAGILRAAGRDALDVETRGRANGQPEAIFDRLRAGFPSMGGPVSPEFVTFSYIAHFVEVRVEATTRRVRVPRVVSVADCGRVVSPRTAESQVRGGVVWGIGAALREASEVDPHFGGFLNADLAEYAIPVNADIGAIEVGFVDEPDPRFNDAGVKGLGEVSMVGVAAALANAIHHATGRRLRHLPIRIEDVL